MTKKITVCGATGTVGNSVALRLLQEGWHVKAITRNQDSAAAKALYDAGAELATADYDDIASLETAFQQLTWRKGTHAIFGITNIFQYLLDDGPDAAAEREKQQLVNVATAASKIETLDHLILHTLPGGEKLAGPGNFVPHMDGKDGAADIIKKELPVLAAKTTFMWIGFFTSNFYETPMLKPVEVPNTNGSHVYIQPADPTLHIYFAGDVPTNAGIFVSAILKNPTISLPAKYAFLYTSQGTMQEYLQAWINVTGRQTTFITTTLENYEKIWGPFGREIGLMLKAFAHVEDWTTPYRGDVVTAKELGLDEGELVDLEAALRMAAEKL
ncbi:hypothetical protein E4T42_04610 [Aureobasidium subglaciale]|nr:hypothetical protein E4T42_04610 [Aureobasidium subglaciale]